MPILRLLNTLKNAIDSQDHLLLDANLIPGSALGELSVYMGHTTAIPLLHLAKEGGIQLLENGDREAIEIKGKAVGRWWGTEGVVVRCLIEEHPEQEGEWVLVVSVSVKKAWTFSEAFPGMEITSMFHQLEFKEVLLTFCNETRAGDDVIPIDLKPGITVSGLCNPAKNESVFQGYLNSDELSFNGGLTATENGWSIRLQTEALHTVHASVAGQASITLSKVTVGCSRGPMPHRPDQCLDMVTFNGLMALEPGRSIASIMERNSSSIGWDLYVSHPDSSHNRALITRLDSSGLLELIPDKWIDFSQVPIEEYFLEFNALAPNESRTGLIVTPTPNETWKTIPVLKNISWMRFRLDFIYQNSASGNKLSFSGGMDARLDIGDTELDMGMRLRSIKDWEFWLKPHDAFPIGELLGNNDHQNMLPATSAELSIDLIRIRLHIDPLKLTSATLKMSLTNWELIPNGLTLKKASVALKVFDPIGSNTAWSGLFQTEFEIEVPEKENITIPIRAMKKADSGWRIQIGASQPVRIPGVADLLALAAVDPAAADQLPAVLTTMEGFELNDLHFNFQATGGLEHAGFQIRQSKGISGVQSDWILVGTKADPKFAIRGFNLRVQLSSNKLNRKLALSGRFAADLHFGKNHVLNIAASHEGPSKPWIVQMAADLPFVLPSAAEAFEAFGAADKLKTMPQAIKAFPGIQLSDLELQLPGKEGGNTQFHMKAALNGPWELIENITVESADTELTVLNEPKTEGSLESATTFDLKINVKADFTDFKMYFGAVHTGASGDWTIVLGLDNRQPLSLITVLGSAFSVLSPDHAPNITTGLFSPDEFDLLIEEANLNYTTSTGKLTGSSKMSVKGKVLDSLHLADLLFEVNNFTVDPKSKKQKVTGNFALKWEWAEYGHFELDLSLAAGANRLSGRWTSKNDDGVPLSEVLKHTPLKLLSNVDGLDIALHELDLNYDFSNHAFSIQAKTTSGQSAVLLTAKNEHNESGLVFSVHAPDGIKLPQIPIIEDALTYQIESFRIVLSTADFDPAPAGVTGLPARITKGVGIEVPLALSFLGKSQTFDLEVNSSARQSGEDENNETPALRSALRAASSTPENKTKWFKINQTIGPLTLHRIGLTFENPQLWVLFDASATLAVLTVELDGLGLAFSPQKLLGEDKALALVPENLKLAGLSIAFEEGPVSIQGGLISKGPNNFEGGAIIKLNDFGLTAVAAYSKQENEDASFYLYAVLNAMLGGPPFFFVEGLAAGIGINRKIHVPAIDKISTFSLVSEAMNASEDSFSERIERLEEDLVPNPDSVFFAAGVKFSTFNLIHSFVLLILGIGEQIELDLVGYSALTMPKPEPGSKKKIDPVAEVRLMIHAAFRPDAGILKVEARLDSDHSYLLSRKCKLQGGFAFYAWFEADHPEPEGGQPGDFVLTLGGYHPHFRAESYYPQVPRLGFHWQVDDHMLFKGEFYFALTPRALMLGGLLSGNWKMDHFEAGFHLGLNMLIQWQPFHYEGGAELSIRAAYRDGLFQVELELSTKIEIWGPEFGGTAHLKILLLEVDVDFGEARVTKPAKLHWPEFAAAFLSPVIEDKTTVTEALSASIVRGLVSKEDRGAHFIGLADPSNLELVIESQVPFTTGTLNNKQLESTNGKKVNTGIGIAPMERTKITSELNVIVTHEGQPVEYFQFESVLKNAPAALWGPSKDTNLNDDATVDNCQFGYRLSPKDELLHPKSGSISKELSDLNPIPYPGEVELFDSDPLPLEWLTDQNAELENHYRSDATRDLLNAFGLEAEMNNDQQDFHPVERLNAFQPKALTTHE